MPSTYGYYYCSGLCLVARTSSDYFEVIFSVCVLDSLLLLCMTCLCYYYRCFVLCTFFQVMHLKKVHVYIMYSRCGAPCCGAAQLVYRRCWWAATRGLPLVGPKTPRLPFASSSPLASPLRISISLIAKCRQML